MFQTEETKRWDPGSVSLDSHNALLQNHYKSPNPHWREKFSFNQFADATGVLEVELCSKLGHRNQEILTA